jgi:hypothetical protein
MKKPLSVFSKWCVSALLAYVMQLGVDWVFPADTKRLYVIAFAGVIGLVWDRLDDAIMGRCRRYGP